MSNLSSKIQKYLDTTFVNTGIHMQKYSKRHHGDRTKRIQTIKTTKVVNSLLQVVN
jgi:hypothetical protein